MEGIGQKYLNSGMYIGFIRNIWNVINFQPIKNDDDDQLFFTEAYLDDEFRKENSFKLDHKSNLFQNLNGNIGKN
jgi:procollagen-lysine,2-oxoglutarate 5-dioxygenase, invertebrate